MSGQRVVIIGGTSGLGFAAARAVADEGGSLVVASRSRDGVDRAVAALPPGTEGRLVDVTREDQVAALFAELGPFDHLIYTAAEPLMNGTLARTKIEEVRHFFGLRFFGALTAVKYGAPHLRPGGSIVLTSGTASTNPLPGTTAVSSVLAAVEGLTRALAIELAPLRVNAVKPGIIRTEMWGGLPESDRNAMYGALADTLLVGPRIGEASDVAATYLYLLTNKHTTGTTITIDGGASLV